LNLKYLNKYAFSLYLLTSSFLYADISGVVFQDLPVNGKTVNSYGVKDDNELGIKGIKVTAYPENKSITTDSSGNWSLPTTVNSRIEFSNIPSYLKESADGNIHNSSVQFVKNGTHNITFGLHDPSDYSDTSTPNYVTNRQQNGSSEGNSNPSIETVHYTDTGLNKEFKDYDGNNGTGAIPTKDTTVEQTGSIWGKAFQKNKKRLFASAVLQRHVGFALNKGAGDIYVLDYSNGTPATLKGSFSLQGITPANGGDNIDLGTVKRTGGNDYELGGVSSPNIDLDAFAKVGKISYGDIDFDQSHNRLWLINLNQKGLISIDASGDFNSLPSNVNQYLIEKLPNAPTCTGGSLRPWALTIHQDRGYIGAICDALSSQNIDDAKAFVLSFDINNPTSGFRQELSFGLNYDKDGENWKPWSDSDKKIGSNWKYYLQPILSDIEFDKKSNMYIGFIDRYGMQGGYYNYEPKSGTTDTKEKTQSFGEILKVCNSNGVFELEGTGNCTNLNNANEFFNDKGGDGADDYATGALALLKGSNEILVALTDPHPQGDTGSKYWETMGTNTLSTTDGTIQNWYSNLASNDQDNGYNGKASGMGDIELLTPPSPLEIGDRVWLDSDKNGIQDANESGISGVKVEFVCNDIVKDTATTDSSGYYIFSNDTTKTSTDSYRYNVTSLTVGVDNCLVRVPNIKGNNKQNALGTNILTIANKTGDSTNSDLVDSDGIENGVDAQKVIKSIEIPLSGANNHSFDFGFTPSTSSIGDKVWQDSNKNGIQDDNETGVSGVKVKLLEDCSTRGETRETTTDSDGKYIFNNLDAGDYCIEFSNLPNGFVATTQDVGGDDTKDSDADTNTLKSTKTTLDAGENDMSWDLGIYNGKASIGDLVWNDINKNGIQDSGEAGIKDITAILYQSDCTTEINSTKTDINGKYIFDNLDTGEYCIGFRDIPSDYAISPKNQGGDDKKDSDIDQSTKTAISTKLDAGENDMSWDMGIYQLASIGDKVWEDSNANGIQDSGEKGVSNVRVKLLKSCTTEIATTKTNANGNYIFNNISPDNYCISFELPNGYIVTDKDIGVDDKKDSDVDSSSMKTSTTDIVAGEADMSWDMGIYKLATIGDKVWIDSNSDGLQNASEKGQSGITVELLKDCNSSIDTKTTDINGNYLFTDVKPDNYCLKFSNIPNRYFITSKDSGGDDTIDSDVDNSSLKTVSTELVSGEDDRSWDMGLVEYASIGDRVWLDSNANGVQDSNEIGVKGVDVTLLKDCKDNDNLGTVSTDINGTYLFANLKPNNYCLKFTLPTGATVTKMSQGSDNNDSDVNKDSMKTDTTNLISGENDKSWDMGIYYSATLGDKVWHDKNINGIQDNNESGIENINVVLYKSDCTTTISTTKTDSNGLYQFNNLSPNEYCIGFDLPQGYFISPRVEGVDRTKDSNVYIDTKKTEIIKLSSGDINSTIDAGIYQSSSLGDTVWFDENQNGLQDNSEIGVDNITVTILPDCNQTNSKEIKTTNGGKYLFENLDAGEYCIEFSDIPSQYLVTKQDIADDNTKDSDVNSTTLRTIDYST